MNRTVRFDERRRMLTAAAALSSGWLGACAGHAAVPSTARVLVVGGGFGGATAAKYLQLFSQQRLDVVLVEPQPRFVSCPVSNLVIGGSRTMADITVPYDDLSRRHGIRVVRDTVSRIDVARRQVVLASGPTIGYDKLVLSPGIELMWDEVEGLRAAHAAGRVLQAWHAGAETQALRRQLEAMPDGGVFAIAIPEAPYRCPPAPYERACQAASYFKQAKPRAKVLILDANPEVTSKGALFRKVWADDYAGIIEYRPQTKCVAVDAQAGVLHFEVQDDVHADVLNVLPPMRAGALAVRTGLATANERWCFVDWLDFQSTLARDVHILGDSLQVAPAMPKSAHMANNQAKVCAAAIVAQLMGWPVNPAPMLANTCYSFVDATRAMHVASVHHYDPVQRTYLPVHGAGGLSVAPNAEEGIYGWSWARSIWSDTLT